MKPRFLETLWIVFREVTAALLVFKQGEGGYMSADQTSPWEVNSIFVQNGLSFQ